MSAASLAHDGATHAGDGSIWMLISMIAFSLFLIAFAWALLRPTKRAECTAVDVATKEFAEGTMAANDFKRIAAGDESHRS